MAESSMSGTEAWARAPADTADMAPLRRQWEGDFRTMAIGFNQPDDAASKDIAGYWLRDADAAQPDPHFTVRLVRAVLIGVPGEPYRVVTEWMNAAAIAYAQNEEAKATESPIQCVEALRREQ